MNQINDPGNPKSFGLDFNYAAWEANNRFTMCNVPWNSDYRDVPAFATTAEFDAYIDAQPSTTRVEIMGTRARLNMPVRLGMTLAKAMKYNYMRIKNGAQPVESGDELQTFYYFIVGMREVAPETTEVLLQLDVWASFRPTMTGCRGFIERGHIGMANSKRMQNNGRDYLSIPEGFDTGSEYIGIKARSWLFMQYNGVRYDANVVVLFASDPDANPYKTVGSTQVPNYTAAKGGKFQGLPSGATVKIWTNINSFVAWLESKSETPWVTQSILSITLMPNISAFYPGWTPDGTGNNGSTPPAGKPSDVTYELANEWRRNILDSLPERYRKLDKFKTSPYMRLELTSMSGTPIAIAPENWNNSHAGVTARGNFMPPNARMQFRPDNYNAPDNRDVSAIAMRDDDGGSFWDFFTQIGNFPTIPIINDNAVLALANQSGSLAYAAQSADWAQQKSLTAAQTGYDQASSAMQLGTDQLGIEQANAQAQNTIQQNAIRGQAVLAMVSGVGGGAGMGAFAGPAGAVAGAAGGAISAAGNNLTAALQMNTMNDQLAQNQKTQSAANTRQNEFGAYIRDSNADLARYAARGDYENTMAGIKARVQDTQMMPASVVGQLGGELINLVNETFGVSLRWKFIDKARMREIGDHWLRYGYAVQQYATLPTSLMAMDRFTYWKMSETYIFGAHIPENYRQALRGILEKGVTLWADPDDINDPNFDIADNNILDGITLP